MWNKDKEPGFVYFVEAPEVGRIKIGVAVDVCKRLNSLRGSSPARLDLRGFIQMPTWSEARAMEQRLHREFVEHRCWGEWFETELCILNRLECLCGVAAQPPEDHWRVCPKTAEERILSDLFS